MKAKDIIKALDEFAPSFLIDSWDNTGFQVGDNKKNVEKVLISLDLDKDILEYSIENKIDMIVTHHPVIFSSVNNITNLTPKGNLLYNIIREDIVIYNAHTNLDRTIGGVNDVLAEIFNLKDIEILSENLEEDDIIYGYGKVGNIDKIDLRDFLAEIKEKLDTETLTVYGDTDKLIDRVAVCGGSGSSFIEDAYKKDADVYITGDIKYHDAQEGVDLGLTIIDAGHYHTEKIILPKLKELLLEKFNNKIDVEVYLQSSPIYKVY